MTKTAEKTIRFGAAHTYIAHTREYSPLRGKTLNHTDLNLGYHNSF